MTRRATTLLILAALLVLLAIPVAAQDEASPAPEATAAPAESAQPAETTEPEVPTSLVVIPAGDVPVAQAVFYFSPTCGHCEYVIAEILPGLFGENGGEYVVTYDESVLPDQPAFYLMSNGHLQLLMVDTSTEAGNIMFSEDSERLGMDQVGVPRVDYGEEDYLVGSGDIPAKLPGVVEEALAGDGLGWPPVPGIDEAIAPFIEDGSVPDPAATPEPEATDPPGPTDAPEVTSEPEATGEAADDEGDDAAAVLPVGGNDGGWMDRFDDDVTGNSVSVVVLVLLLISAIAAPILAIRGSLPSFPGWLVIVLALVGAGVAAYLANVETTGNAAVCGPVGDCNAVQESEYAEVLGIPIGVLGLLGYAAIGVLWVLSRVTSGVLATVSLVLIGVGAWIGTLFSIYLTFLEPFVIGATCMWCITSALVMMALLWISAGPAYDAWNRLRGEPLEQAQAGA